MVEFQASGLLHSVSFYKSGAEIKAACERQIDGLLKSIETRTQRIATIREEHKIDGDAYAELLRDKHRNRNTSVANYSYTRAVARSGDAPEEQTFYVPAGVVAQLEAESDNRDRERDLLALCNRVAKNILAVAPVGYNKDHAVGEPLYYELSQADLKFLGF